MSIDYNKVAKIEQEIAKKYGKEAIVNPKSNWNEDKEKQFKTQISEFYKTKNHKSSEQDSQLIEGIKVSKKLLNKESIPFCPVCSKQPNSSIDDVMLVKFDCCNKCYVRWVEGREERWRTGWRPNDNGNKNG